MGASEVEDDQAFFFPSSEQHTQRASPGELLPKQSAGGWERRPVGFITPDMGGGMGTMATRCAAMDVWLLWR